MSIPVCSNLHDFKDIKGTNDVADDIISECFIYTKNNRPKITKEKEKNVDVKIIFGICNSSAEWPLILLKFHGELKISRKKAKKLYHYVYNKYIKKGIEVHKTGSSSGLTTNPRDDSLLYFFLNTHIPLLESLLELWLCRRKIITK